MVSLVQSMLTYVTSCHIFTFTRGLLVEVLRGSFSGFDVHIPDIRPHNCMLVKTILCHSIIPDDCSGLHLLISQEIVVIIPCSRMFKFPKSGLLIYYIIIFDLYQSQILAFILEDSSQEKTLNCRRWQTPAPEIEATKGTTPSAIEGLHS